MRRFIIPEVIQTSAMDCGPASLKALLEAYGIHASYGRLREACQTEVDGTSIDTIEDIAVRLNLDAAQVMVPLDHLFEPKAGNLPALLVVRQPNGTHHFVVVWRQHGPWLQVMDPAIGRRWVKAERFLEDVYEHEMPIEAATWREWAASDDFLNVLRVRLRRLGVDARELISEAGDDCMARLDAAARMTERLATSGAVRRGKEAARMVASLSRGNLPIPAAYWTARPAEEAGQVMLRGAVLVRVSGRCPASGAVEAAADTAPLPAELNAALREKPARPGLELLRVMAEDGAGSAASIALGLLLASIGSVAQALLLRGLCDVARQLTSAGQRVGAVAATLALLGALVVLEFVLAAGVLRKGRRLELRLRLRFLYKIPRLADWYFRSRPMSDMAERSHNVHRLREAPELAALFLRNALEMAVTVAAIAVFYPAVAWPAVLTGMAALGIPLLAQPILAERDLKSRSHAGALLRFNLDALLGVTAIRAHGAAGVVRSEHGVLLGDWARAGFALQRTVTWIEGLQMTASLALAAWVVWSGLMHTSDIAGALLLVYWVLNLPALGQEAAYVAWQYPMLRNTALRFVEPLGAPEDPVVDAGQPATQCAAAVRLDEVTVVAGGHRILEDVSLDIPAGAHVAIVGRSGAGKSSLVGLLLGWHRASAGRVQVDGEELDAAALGRLRASTAWVDPQVQIWNRSLYENLMYGNEPGASPEQEMLDLAELKPVAERLAAGMQTQLGEGGGLLSGGEGQRVRQGRALARAAVRLVVLDEPGRGLDRTQRRKTIQLARRHWSHATLLCITHDVSDSLDFDRVLVMEDRRIVDDGSPARLAADAGSRYRQMLDAETTVRGAVWGNACWRRFRLEGGRLLETEGVQEHARRHR